MQPVVQVVAGGDGREHPPDAGPFIGHGVGVAQQRVVPGGAVGADLVVVSVETMRVGRL